MRDRVEAAQAQAGRLPAEYIERGPHGPHHEMGLSRARGAAAFTGDLDVQPPARHPGHGHVVQGQRETQGVEAGAEVRAAGRGADHDGFVPPSGCAHGVSPEVRAARPTKPHQPLARA